MQAVVLSIMNRFGYWGIGGLILIENLFPPIPSEVILVFGGFLTTCTQMSAVGVILTATAASLKGAFLLYCLGRWLGPGRVASLLGGRVGKRLGFHPEELADTESWFRRKGQKAVLFGRCVPIIRSLISIPAGMARMNLVRFALYTALGSLVWNTVLVLLGAAAGESWEIILQYMDAYSALIKIGLATAGVVFFLRVRGKGKGKRGKQGKETEGTGRCRAE